MQTADIVEALIPVVALLERLSVRYYVGGSVASSTYGRARATADVDLVAELLNRHVSDVITELSPRFYASPTAIEAAVRNRTCFNLIYQRTSSKVDIFVSRDRPFDREALARTRPEQLDPDSPRTTQLASAEDVILSKLEWYRLSNESLDRQIDDIVGILKVQAGLLDSAYLEHWAKELRVSDLLARALEKS